MADAAVPNPATEALAIARERLFETARTTRAWLDRPVEDAVLHRLYELVRLAPTAFNASPARIVFVKSAAAKAHLLAVASQGNQAAIQAAPVTAIVAYDTRFYEHLPRLFPQYDAARLFAEDRQLAETTAFRNGTLQGGYLILAARLLGLAAGPMSGFDNARLDAAFFPDGRIRSNFLCNLGYAGGSPAAPRNPRLDFAEACSIV